jgi:hypothetical protein
MFTHHVRALLMGGQACVFYGAAEFSRDTHFAILADNSNLKRLKKALAELRAERIAVPPFELRFLGRGHAVHFRCQHPEATRLRVDIMSKMRGVASFESLWRRRSTVELPDVTKCELLSLPDLVQAKKTQRDKDWPMIRRLVEAHYFENRGHASAMQIRFWLRELRTPELLSEIASANAALARRLVPVRSLLGHALVGDLIALENALKAQESAERQRDKLYWVPLRQELERLRHGK